MGIKIHAFVGQKTLFKFVRSNFRCDLDALVTFWNHVTNTYAKVTQMSREIMLKQIGSGFT